MGIKRSLKLSKRINSLCLIVSLVIISNKAFSWCDTSDFRQNYISLELGTHYFFDGNPMLTRNASNSWVNLSYGLSYMRSITKKDYIKVSLERYHFNPYPPYNYGGKSPGDFDGRSLFMANLDYNRLLLDYNRLNLFVSGGMQYRHGDEHIIHYYYGGFEKYTSNILLRDIGVNVGMLLTYRVALGFTLSLKAAYTYYFYRYENEAPQLIYNNGSTNQMFQIKIGLGYNFGKWK